MGQFVNVTLLILKQLSKIYFVQFLFITMMNSSYTVSCDSSCAYSAIVALTQSQNKALILAPLNLALSQVLKWGKKKKMSGDISEACE